MTSRVLKEATDFVECCYRELNKSELEIDNRLNEIKKLLVTQGHYTHTNEELVHGAKMAWQNSNRCIGRLFWNNLLNIAVLHSFKEAEVSIVNHHTATQQFKKFEDSEIEVGRKVTGNWAWLIPPFAPATTHIFHKSYNNEKRIPNYVYQNPPY